MGIRQSVKSAAHNVQASFGEAERGGYQYILLCSGQDLLVRDGLDAFLTDNYGKVFTEGYFDDRTRRAFLLHDWPDRYRNLMDFTFHPVKMMRRLRLEIFKAGIPLAVKKVNYDVSSINFYLNLFWAAMPTFIVEYIIDFLDKNPTFWEIYDKALVAEEGFFLTIIMNSQYKNCVDFIDGKCHALTYSVHTRKGHSSVITMKDIDAIKASGRFFARKFDIRADKEVVAYFAKQKDI